MRIFVLSENTAGKNCRGEHGLSFLVEADQTILFDVGASGLFLENARQLKLDLDNVETVVLSHGHDDHTNGLAFLSQKKLIAHPDSLLRRFRKSDRSSLGLNFTRAELEVNFQLVLSREPVPVSEQIIFLGEIPRMNDFEAKTTAFVLEDGREDFVMDDSGLAVKTDAGLVVISGCAHAGICNMVAHAMLVTGETQVAAVIGGFHLTQNDQATKKTIGFLKERGVRQVIPSHCTALPALAAFHAEFPFVQSKAGNILRF